MKQVVGLCVVLLSQPVATFRTNSTQNFEKIADSKTLNEDQREELFKEITSHPKIFWATGMADNKEIDEVNILQATMLSMHRAIKK